MQNQLGEGLHTARRTLLIHTATLAVLDSADRKWIVAIARMTT
jgi:hypothetical protein